LAARFSVGVCDDGRAAVDRRLRPTQLEDVVAFAAPWLGPEAVLKCGMLAPAILAATGRTLVCELAGGNEWAEYFETTSPPLVRLMQTIVAPRVVERAAALASLRPNGLGAALAPDERGRSALVTAARISAAPLGRSPSSSSAVLRVVLAARAAPDEPDESGWTALMWAAQRGDGEACRTLLRGRADVNKLSRDGACALFCATRSDHKPVPIVRLLLGALADPSRVPVTGATGDHMDPEVHAAMHTAIRAHALAGENRRSTVIART